jgi:hypothetical protein
MRFKMFGLTTTKKYNELITDYDTLKSLFGESLIENAKLRAEIVALQKLIKNAEYGNFGLKKGETEITSGTFGKSTSANNAVSYSTTEVTAFPPTPSAQCDTSVFFAAMVAANMANHSTHTDALITAPEPTKSEPAPVETPNSSGSGFSGSPSSSYADDGFASSSSSSDSGFSSSSSDFSSSSSGGDF